MPPPQWLFSAGRRSTRNIDVGNLFSRSYMGILERRTSPRSTGFCAIWDCISSSSRAHG